MVLSAKDLQEEIKQRTLTIEPFSEDAIRENGIDLRISTSITRLQKQSVPLDMQSENKDDFYLKESNLESFTIRPFEKILLATLEKITLPNYLMAFCQLRSTFARSGISIPPTVVDAGFSGNLTIQINGSSFPVKIQTRKRFLHLIFVELKTPLLKGYNGKYQNDKGIGLPKKDR